MARPLRVEWIARVLGVLEGLRCGDDAAVVLVDSAGRRIRLQRDDQGAATLTNLVTGADLPYAAGHLSLDGRFDWFASVGLTSREAVDLIVVDSGAFTGGDESDIAHEPDAVLAAVRAAEDWSVAVGTVADTWRAFGRRPRLDKKAQDQALVRPAEVPPDLETQAKTCRAAAERRDELVARLQAGGADAEDLRRELDGDVEPAYVDALAELAAVCRPFGVIIDTARIGTVGIEAAGIETLGAQVVAEVRSQAAEAGRARLQLALEEAEAACQAAQQRVESCLAKAGFPSGRTGALAGPAPPGDHRAGLERRIAALEASLRAGCLPRCTAVKKVLLGRAAQAHRAGRAREPFPLLVNDAFAAYPAADKTTLLDTLARLGEKTQIVYLTDDPATLTWASSRVDAGELTLCRAHPVEPGAEIALLPGLRDS